MTVPARGGAAAPACRHVRDRVPNPDPRPAPPPRHSSFVIGAAHSPFVLTRCSSSVPGCRHIAGAGTLDHFLGHDSEKPLESTRRLVLYSQQSACASLGPVVSLSREKPPMTAPAIREGPGGPPSW